MFGFALINRKINYFFLIVDAFRVLLFLVVVAFFVSTVLEIISSAVLWATSSIVGSSVVTI